MIKRKSKGFSGRSRSRQRMLRWAATVTALTTIAMGEAAAPAHAYKSDRCNFATVIGVRGSNEPAGTGLANDERIYRDGGLGNVVGNLAAGLESRLDLPIHVEAINYPAVIASPGSEVASNYIASVGLGAKNLIQEIQDLSHVCSGKPIVLAGYSQGADVIKAALGGGSNSGGGVYSLSASAKANIRAVVLYGSPSYHAGEPWNAEGSGTSNGIFGHGNNPFESYKAMAWIPPSYSTQELRPIIRSYCLAGDLFCQQNFTKEGKDIHSSYPNTSVMNDSHEFVAEWLIDYN